MAKLLQTPLPFGEQQPLPPDPELDWAHDQVSRPFALAESGGADSKQRAEALDIHRSWIVEAPAGSGKTGLLIQRYLRLLAEADVDRPEQVLGITFTRKADAEMRGRVLNQLAAARGRTALPADATPADRTTRHFAEKVLQRDRTLGWNLLENPQQLNIRTIDSLCAELAGSTPLHTGPGGRYSPTDDPDPLYALAAGRTLARLGNEEKQLTADLECLLLHRDALPTDVQRLLADMLRNRSAWGDLIPLSAEALTDEALDTVVRPQLERALGRLLGIELERAAVIAGPFLLGRLAALGHALSTYPGLPADSPLAACAGFGAAAPPTQAEALPHWAALLHLLFRSGGAWRKRINKGTFDVKLSPQHQAEIEDLLDAFQVRGAEQPQIAKTLWRLRDLPSAKLPDEQWRVVQALCRVLREALLELQFVFGERQSCDFTEVALVARSVLRADGAAAESLHALIGNLRHLLVDEMQDTSAGQYELLENLTQSWDGASQTMFLVGDPKQSIYEFRQARVERFRRVMEQGRFGQITLAALRLTDNFRSQAGLVDAFNQTFERILPPPDDPSLRADSPEVGFVRATARRKRGADPALFWHLTPRAAQAKIAGEQFAGAETATAEDPADPADEAKVIRSIIEDFLRDWRDGHNTRPPRVAVLARARTHLAAILQEFQTDHGEGPLAFRAVDIEALQERPEILDLLAMTRALLDPEDRVAWLALLRSPVCGLTLPDLLALTGDAAESASSLSIPSRVEIALDTLSEDGRARLLRVWAVLRHAQAIAGRTPFATHVERTWRSLGGDTLLRANEKANALRFLDLLHALESGPDPLSLPLIQRRLRTLYAEPSSPEAVVELMTIHKAKGLEWDLVLVPGLQRGSGRSDQEFLKWLEFDNPEGSQDFLLAPIQSKGEEASALSRWINRQQHAREVAEARRLLYVACTRAREKLHLFASVEVNRDGEVTEPRDTSLLAAAWPAAKPEFLRQQAGPSTLGESDLELSEAPQSDLALAAAAENSSPARNPVQARRLPASFRPWEAFAAAAGSGLSYPPAGQLPHAATFSRPEGSFPARAFGNALHRFLAVVADRLASGISRDDLLADLPGWHNRIVSILRAEGLAPGDAPREARRALQALTLALSDAEGSWLLGPRTQARNESPVPSAADYLNRSLRADRTFRAGPEPGTEGQADFLWIVDYKTVDLGGRNHEDFLQSQKQHYAAQMEAYAEAAVAGGQPPDRLRLALFFPLLPALVFWPADQLPDQKM